MAGSPTSQNLVDGERKWRVRMSARWTGSLNVVASSGRTEDLTESEAKYQKRGIEVSSRVWQGERSAAERVAV